MLSTVPLYASWQFFEPVSKQWFDAEVPGCVHTDLRRHGLISDPFWGDNEKDLQWIEEKDWSYRCEFEIEETLLKRGKVEIVAEGLDTLATVRLNGQQVGTARNMFLEHRFDVSEVLRPGTNLIEIDFETPMKHIRERLAATPDHYGESNDAVGGSSFVRKQGCSFGWDWAPRFATCGIWLPIRLEAWSGNRIESVRVVQTHSKNQDKVDLLFEPTLVVSGCTALTTTGTISFGETVIAQITNNRATINEPALWWPNGLGEQSLYMVVIELHDVNGEVLDTWTRRIGLRTIVIDRHPDEFGESFQFAVNGRVIFAKGANWVPAHAFITEAQHDHYSDLLTSAVEANMNMIRVWGGNVYEKEIFYDLCDELGLLVWQDFMFACALYPGDEAFLEQVTLEADYQVRRLAHRASLALWCGNNEIEQNPHEIAKTAERKKAYDDIFYRILPTAVKQGDGVTTYWPSSPHNPEGYEKGADNEQSGDCHYWDVWHGRKSVKAFEETKFRFCSEFGMQSYSSPEVAATYCLPEAFNAYGPEMENHQKNASGNQVIMDYVSRLFRFPKDFAGLSYLSQLNQAYGVKIGVEHFRRSMPRTMGALYWQLNDCWPVASWSSIEFGGNWKALHYEAKRFFAPALVSAHVLGEERAGKCNVVSNTMRQVDLYTVYDAPTPTQGTLHWSLEHLGHESDGPLCNNSKSVKLEGTESTRQLRIDCASEIAEHGVRSLYLRVKLETTSGHISRQTVFFTAQRYLPLQRKKIVTQLRQVDPYRWELSLDSSVFQHAVQFHFKATNYRAEDNFFDLFPGESRTVKFRTKLPHSEADLLSALEVRSLVDSY